MSLPSRERGLKFLLLLVNRHKFSVAPFAGAWIEICYCICVGLLLLCRSLRGSVD